MCYQRPFIPIASAAVTFISASSMKDILPYNENIFQAEFVDPYIRFWEFHFCLKLIHRRKCLKSNIPILSHQIIIKWKLDRYIAWNHVFLALEEVWRSGRGETLKSVRKLKNMVYFFLIKRWSFGNRIYCFRSCDFSVIKHKPFLTAENIRKNCSLDSLRVIILLKIFGKVLKLINTFPRSKIMFFTISGIFPCLLVDRVAQGIPPQFTWTSIFLRFGKPPISIGIQSELVVPETDNKISFPWKCRMHCIPGPADYRTYCRFALAGALLIM